MTYPKGVLEDVLAKVDKFIFYVDFIVLDMEEDKEIPIILGRHFLATGRAMIDVQKRELTMRVNDQGIKFNVLKSMKYPDKQKCYRMDIIDYIIGKHYQEKCKIISEEKIELLFDETKKFEELKEEKLSKETHYIKEINSNYD